MCWHDVAVADQIQWKVPDQKSKDVDWSEANGALTTNAQKDQAYVGLPESNLVLLRQSMESMDSLYLLYHVIVLGHHVQLGSKCIEQLLQRFVHRILRETRDSGGDGLVPVCITMQWNACCPPCSCCALSISMLGQ
jgi:hypothetical protein